MNYAPTARIVTAPSPGSSGTSWTLAEDAAPRFPAVPFTALVWEGQAIPVLGTNAEEVDVTGLTDAGVVEATRGTPRVSIEEDWQMSALRVMPLSAIDEPVTLTHTFSVANPPYHIHTRSPDGVAGSAAASAAGAVASYTFDPDTPGVWAYRFSGVSEEGPDQDFFVKFSTVLP